MAKKAKESVGPSLIRGMKELLSWKIRSQAEDYVGHRTLTSAQLNRGIEFYEAGYRAALRDARKGKKNG